MNTMDAKARRTAQHEEEEEDGDAEAQTSPPEPEPAAASTLLARALRFKSRREDGIFTPDAWSPMACATSLIILSFLPEPAAASGSPSSSGTPSPAAADGGPGAPDADASRLRMSLKVRSPSVGGSREAADGHGEEEYCCRCRDLSDASSSSSSSDFPLLCCCCGRCCCCPWPPPPLLNSSRMEALAHTGRPPPLALRWFLSPQKHRFTVLAAELSPPLQLPASRVSATEQRCQRPTTSTPIL